MKASIPSRPMPALWLKALTVFLTAILSVGLFGCTVEPDYLRPAAPVPATYKEPKGWIRATPAQESDRGPWWSVFQDTKLDSFEPQVEISNQTVAAAEAAYRQSLAIIKKDQAGLFPTATLNYALTRSYAGSSGGSFSTIPGTSVAVSTGGVSSITAVSTLSANGSWDPDLWGKTRGLVESDVSAADLANAKLSAQALLATAYYNLRAAVNGGDKLCQIAA